MNNRIEELLKEIDNFKADKVQDVEDIRIKYFGKKGELTKLFDDFRSVLPEHKKELGKRLNVLKTKAAEKLEELRTNVSETIADKKAAYDYTKPGDLFELGSRHPISITKEEIIRIFSKFGYQVAEGPSIEDDWHVFGALNFPP